MPDKVQGDLGLPGACFPPSVGIVQTVYKG